MPSEPAVSQPEHHPRRPEWTCADCGEVWPCASARDRLLAETGGGTALAILMWTYLEDFLREVVGQSAGVFDRFLGWTRPPRD